MIRKVGLRYRQAEIVGTAAIERLERTAGLTSAVRWLREAHVAEHFGVEKPTQELRSFFARWSIKFLSRILRSEGTASLRRPIIKQQQAVNPELIINRQRPHPAAVAARSLFNGQRTARISK